ncbi:MAG: hypothetical protein ABI967_14460 [bacterium]
MDFLERRGNPDVSGERLGLPGVHCRFAPPAPKRQFYEPSFIQLSPCFLSYGAAYRFNHDHWNFDQVYAEMKDYDFSTRFGNGKMKDFVQDYWQQLQAKQAGAPATSTVTC